VSPRKRKNEASTKGNIPKLNPCYKFHLKKDDGMTGGSSAIKKGGAFVLKSRIPLSKDATGFLQKKKKKVAGQGIKKRGILEGGGKKKKNR